MGAGSVQLLFLFCLHLCWELIPLSLASVFLFSVYGLGGKLDKAAEMFAAAQELGLEIG